MCRSTIECLICLGIVVSVPYLLCCYPSSTISLFNQLSFLVSALSSLFWLIFKGSAYVFVSLLQACSFVAHGIHGGFCCIANFIRDLTYSLLEKALELAALAASTIADFLIALGPEIAKTACEGFSATMEHVKSGIECLQKVVPEITRIVVDMITKVIKGLWSSYFEALKYFAEKKENNDS